MFTHLLLPTDGSRLSEVAIQKGVQFAKSINAKVTGPLRDARIPRGYLQDGDAGGYR